jgi:hypothetical protein
MASTTCPSCQSEVSEGTAFCPNCGASQAVGATAAPATGVPQVGSPAPAAKPQMKVDLASIARTDRIVGIFTLILFISLFLPWFKVTFSFVTASASGLSAHGYLYIVLILSLAILAFLAAEISGVWKLPASSQLTREQVLLIATVINFVLVLIAFLFKPGGSAVGWDWGAFVALIASVLAALPLVVPAVQARRGK